MNPTQHLSKFLTMMDGLGFNPLGSKKPFISDNEQILQELNYHEIQMYSQCCSAEVDIDTGFCPDCKEHIIPHFFCTGCQEYHSYEDAQIVFDIAYCSQRCYVIVREDQKGADDYDNQNNR